MCQQVQSLCGQVPCPRLCVRAEHCQAGLQRRRQLLARQAVRRLGRQAEEALREPVGYTKTGEPLWAWRRYHGLMRRLEPWLIKAYGGES